MLGGLGPNIGKGLASVVAGSRAATVANVMNSAQLSHGQASVLPRDKPVTNGLSTADKQQS